MHASANGSTCVCVRKTGSPFSARGSRTPVVGLRGSLPSRTARSSISENTRRICLTVDPAYLVGHERRDPGHDICVTDARQPNPVPLRLDLHVDDCDSASCPSLRRRVLEPTHDTVRVVAQVSAELVWLAEGTHDGLDMAGGHIAPESPYGRIVKLNGLQRPGTARPKDLAAMIENPMIRTLRPLVLS